MKSVRARDLDVYFTGRERDGTVTPVTIDRSNPYFRGSEMAYTVLDRAREVNPKAVRGIGVYRITAARAEKVPRRKL